MAYRIEVESNTRRVTIEGALEFRNAGNLPDEVDRTLGWCFVSRTHRISNGSHERRLEFGPDYQDAPTWRREGSRRQRGVRFVVRGGAGQHALVGGCRTRRAGARGRRGREHCGGVRFPVSTVASSSRPSSLFDLKGARSLRDDCCLDCTLASGGERRSDRSGADELEL